MLSTLIRQAERVHVGCLAQFVNVIAPIFTSPGSVLRRSIFYPYAWAPAHAKGEALDLHVECDSYAIEREYRDGRRGSRLSLTEPVPTIDVSATYDQADGSCALSLLNRDLDKEPEVALEWQGAAPTQTPAFDTLTGSDLKGANSFNQPERVKPEPLDLPPAGARMSLKLPPRSHSILRLAVRAA
jgi:alpha-N-arabinofuranosidase